MENNYGVTVGYNGGSTSAMCCQIDKHVWFNSGIVYPFEGQVCACGRVLYHTEKCGECGTLLVKPLPNPLFFDAEKFPSVESHMELNSAGTVTEKEMEALRQFYNDENNKMTVKEFREKFLLEDGRSFEEPSAIDQGQYNSSGYCHTHAEDNLIDKAL